VSKDYLERWLGAKSTPVIEADGFDPVIGYQPDKLKEIINAFGN
jgi:glutaredoxin-like protein NrdH